MTEEREELQSEQNRLLNSLNCEKGKDIKQVKKSVADMELSVEKLQKQERKYIAELKTAIAEFDEIQAQSSNFDELELVEYRLHIRPNKQEKHYTELRRNHGINFDEGTAIESFTTTDNMVCEDLYSKKRSIRERLRYLQQQQERA